MMMSGTRLILSNWNDVKYWEGGKQLVLYVRVVMGLLKFVTFIFLDFKFDF